MSDSRHLKSEDIKSSGAGGTLYVVSTPIGNLGDITHRAVETLKTADLIAAEDTRRASIIAKKFEITTPRLSYHEYNAQKRIPQFLRRLKAGENIALISDAGTPGISDPGFKLIRNCIEKEISVTAIPGASAFLPALVVSGLPTDRFVFEGFLPVKKGRKTRLEFLINEKRTIIFYESPHRLLRTVKDLCEYFGERQLVIVRELTKLYEEIIRTTTTDAVQLLEKRKLKGEFVLVVHGAPKKSG
ncbi:16S rRNA (cytidine(1402)-2'-O)-methyltransferase [candidate division KSB1 bacterium]|nr:16S rRNA (cytidine(1402)-2'-O)-methyltransferase [candidate division KSB1 bacterium]